jgi:hypothetical protein
MLNTIELERKGRAGVWKTITQDEALTLLRTSFRGRAREAYNIVLKGETVLTCLGVAIRLKREGEQAAM